MTGAAAHTVDRSLHLRGDREVPCRPTHLRAGHGRVVRRRGLRLEALTDEIPRWWAPTAP